MLYGISILISDKISFVRNIISNKGDSLHINFQKQAF